MRILYRKNGNINMLFKNFYRDIEEETNTKYLDDDTLLFCCKHGLSINKSDYTEDKLAAIKAKALQEKKNIEIKIVKICIIY